MKQHQQIGFSLVEMAVVLVILGFVIGIFLLPLGAQRDITYQLKTDNQLELAQKALIGFAQAYGRLPCPATATSNDDAGSLGVEQPISGGGCQLSVGFLPAATLGISPVDRSGFAIDGWGNRIRYAVTQNPAASPPFTTVNGMATVGMSSLVPDIQVLDRVSGNLLINNAVAVIFSVGKTATNGLGGADEDENLNGDNVFISHDIEANGVNGEFDHRLIWLSPYVLYNAMIQAGQLP